jgi:Type VI secretion system/phage-baseplate injector OB domain
MKSNTLVAGIVEDLDDPEHLGRVRVTYPHLDEQMSNWARSSGPSAVTR